MTTEHRSCRQHQRDFSKGKHRQLLMSGFAGQGIHLLRKAVIVLIHPMSLISVTNGVLLNLHLEVTIQNCIINTPTDDVTPSVGFVSTIKCLLLPLKCFGRYIITINHNQSIKKHPFVSKPRDGPRIVNGLVQYVISNNDYTHVLLEYDRCLFKQPNICSHFTVSSMYYFRYLPGLWTQ